MNNELIKNIDLIHTTKLGKERIKKNLNISGDVVLYTKKFILNEESIITKVGKNYYVELNNITITINSYNYSIITAHRNKEMYLKKYLEQFSNKKIKLFVDMDGVIADYVYNEARSYDKKRPLYNNIKKLEIISKLPNIELYIFSATRYNEGTNEKHWWLDTYAPFFKKENRIIISREANNMEKTDILKAEYLKKYKRDDSILIVIDDDPRNLKEIKRLNEDVIVLKDTVLVD
jgi:hypothetical protein